MTDTESEHSSEEAITPAKAFSLLGDEVRVEIIAVLDEAECTRLSFSQLHDRVGLADSGQFNYHLSKLVDHFVSKTENGYQLTAAGDRLARAIAAGLYTHSPGLDPFDVDGHCFDCGEHALKAAYTDEQFTITCSVCDNQLLGVQAPPSLVRGRSPEAALEAFEEWSYRQVQQARDGFCPFCGGTIEKGLTRNTPEQTAFEVLPEMTCTVCGERVYTSFAAIARSDPAVEAFQEQYNPAYPDRHYWELAEYMSDEYLELLSESPFRMQVQFRASGRICEAVVDDSLTVVRTTIRNEDG